MMKINVNTVLKLFFLIPIITVTVFLAKIAYTGPTDSATAGPLSSTSGVNINSNITVYSPASTSFSFQNPNNTTSSTSPPSSVGNNMNWAYSPTINTSLPVLDQGINGVGGTYPPCPGDPSQAPPQLDPSVYAQLPKTPICPDINGNFPHPYEYLDNQVNSIYYAAQTTQGFYTIGQIFCPDYCTVTRASTPPAPTVPITSPILVTSFQEASCPDGYVAVADFNELPAIQYLAPVNGNTLEPPYTSLSEFNAKNNDPNYWCSIYLTSYNTVQYPANDSAGNIIPAPVVPPGFSVANFHVPVAPGGYYNSLQTNSGFFNYANSYKTCSGPAGIDTLAPDTFTEPSGPQENINGDGLVGEWIPALTWTQFWNNLGGTFGTNTSYALGETTCWGDFAGGNYHPDISAGVAHYDIWWHYYRYESCQFVLPANWYFTSSVVPASKVCARIKPVWQQMTK